MLSFRHQLLQTFGIEYNYAAIVCQSIQLQKPNDLEPFAEIVTDKKGHTVLRVGQIQSNTIPVLTIR